MQQGSVVEKLIVYLSDSKSVSAETFEPSANLFETKAIDSYDTLELSIYIEEAFGVQLDEEKIAQLGTIEAIAAHVVSIS